MLWAWEALAPDGRTRQGTLDAPDERAAAAALRDRALYLLRLDHAARSGPASAAEGGARASRRLKAAALVFFLRELALMTRSGVTLLQALEVCARRSGSAAVGRVARRLAGSIRGGQGLSGAMRTEPRVFSPLMVRLVESAEATGELDPVLERIADLVERRTALRRTLVTSLLYPALVFLVSIGVAVFLVVGVVPRFAQFLVRRDVALPWTTQALLDVSAFVQRAGPGIVALLAVLVAVGLPLALSRRGRPLFDRCKLALPVAGPILRVAAFAQFAWTLGALLRSGVGLVESIRITAQVVGNRAIARRLEAAREEILAGRPLSGSLDHPIVPAIVPSLVAAGERAGAMTEVLGELASYYRRDLELRLRRMSSLVEPVLILIVGGMVAFVYFAFFHALLSLVSR